jgi:hypothetical protein
MAQMRQIEEVPEGNDLAPASSRNAGLPCPAILIPKKQSALICGSLLQGRADRVSRVTFKTLPFLYLFFTNNPFSPVKFLSRGVVS